MGIEVDTAHTVISAVSYLLVVSGVLGVAFTVTRSSSVKTTLEAQDKTIAALKDGLEEQERLRGECQKDIALLREEVNILKTLPLAQILDNQQQGLDLLNALVVRNKSRTKAR